MLLLVSALTLALIESSQPGSNQVAAGIPETTGMSANNVTNGHGSFLWNTFGGGGGGSGSGGGSGGGASSNLISA